MLCLNFVFTPQYIPSSQAPVDLPTSTSPNPPAYPHNIPQSPGLVSVHRSSSSISPINTAHYETVSGFLVWSDFTVTVIIFHLMYFWATALRSSKGNNPQDCIISTACTCFKIVTFTFVSSSIFKLSYKQSFRDIAFFPKYLSLKFPHYCGRCTHVILLRTKIVFNCLTLHYLWNLWSLRVTSIRFLPTVILLHHSLRSWEQKKWLPI